MAPAKAYLTACWRSEMRGRMFFGTLAGTIVGLLGLAATGVLEPNAMKVQARRLADLNMPTLGTMPGVLTAEKERALKASDSFQECWSCPEMVAVPAGEFMMGSPETEQGRSKDEGPQRKVTISAALAIGRFEVTFDEWDGCVAHAGCPAEGVAAANIGRGRQPVINVSWEDAKKYVDWLSKRTGKTYRLLTEAEWEYAARAGKATRFSFGDDDEALGEHTWFSDNSENRTHAVGAKRANAFGLHDMHGNVTEWVEDYSVENYNVAPTDGASWKEVYKDKTSSRVVRGGSWGGDTDGLRSASRCWDEPVGRDYGIGFRVARVLSPARTLLPP